MKIPLTPVRCLYRAIDLYGPKEGVINGPDRFTYARFGERCERLASSLRNAGVEKGDRVGFLSFNTNRLIEGYFGVPMAGGIVMPLNVRLTPTELGGILRHAEPVLLFYEADFAPLVAHLQQAWPRMRVVNLDTEYENFIAEGEPRRIDFMAVDEDSICELFYTSGSTGMPKGVALSHRTLYLHTLTVGWTFYPEDTAVELHTIPLFHANGWGRPQCATMMGLKQVMVRRFDPANVFRLIQEERATSLALVPTMAGAMLMSPELGKHDLSSLKTIFIGGAASSPELIARMEAAIGCQVLAGYGLTETSPVVSSARKKSTVDYANDEDRYRHQAMAGWPIPGTEIRVVDGEMRDVPRDSRAIGEVVIRGDNVMEGYYKEPAATAAVMTGAWFHTGDMAVWDAENFIHIVDRQKDIIISGGENISSIEVERVIAMHPAVAEAAVVGAPDSTWGEIPVAFVHLKPGAHCGEAELAGFLTGKLARFKCPRRYEFVTEPLPKGGTGKVLKRELREKFWAGKERRVQG